MIPSWFQPGASRERAGQLLANKLPGSFLIRSSSKPSTLALSVKLDEDIQHFIIEISARSTVSLEDSELKFESLVALVSYYSQIRDELPVCLRIPDNYNKTDMEGVNRRKSRETAEDFWVTSPLCSYERERKKTASLTKDLEVIESVMRQELELNHRLSRLLSSPPADPNRQPSPQPANTSTSSISIVSIAANGASTIANGVPQGGFLAPPSTEGVAYRRASSGSGWRESMAAAERRRRQQEARVSVVSNRGIRLEELELEIERETAALEREQLEAAAAEVKREQLDPTAALEREQLEAAAVRQREQLETEAAVEREKLEAAAMRQREQLETAAALHREQLKTAAEREKVGKPISGFSREHLDKPATTDTDCEAAGDEPEDDYCLPVDSEANLYEVPDYCYSGPIPHLFEKRTSPDVTVSASTSSPGTTHKTSPAVRNPSTAVEEKSAKFRRNHSVVVPPTCLRLSPVSVGESKCLSKSCSNIIEELENEDHTAINNKNLRQSFIRKLSNSYNRKKSETRIEPIRKISAVMRKIFPGAIFQPGSLHSSQENSNSWEYLPECGGAVYEEVKPEMEKEGKISSVENTSKKTENSLRRATGSCDSLYESEYSSSSLGSRGSYREDIRKDDIESPPCLPFPSVPERGIIQDYVKQLLQTHNSISGFKVKFCIDSIHQSENSAQQIMKQARECIHTVREFLLETGEGELHQLIQLQQLRLNENQFLDVSALLEQAVASHVLEQLERLLVMRLRREVVATSLVAKARRSRADREKGRQEEAVREVVTLFLGHLASMERRLMPGDKLQEYLQGVHSINNRSKDLDMRSVILNLPESDLVSLHVQCQYIWGLLDKTQISANNLHSLYKLASIFLQLEERVSEVTVLVPEYLTSRFRPYQIPIRPNMKLEELKKQSLYCAELNNCGQLFLALDKNPEIVLDEEENVDSILLAGHSPRFILKKENSSLLWQKSK